MCSDLEKLINMILTVIEMNNIVKFGSEEHLRIIRVLDNMKSIKEIKTTNDKHVKIALELIKKDKKLFNILKEDGINI